jgi:phosphatidylinositol alpha-mannosyltransferase
MAAASVFCAPSLGGESFGVILLEAMAAGTPVIASAIEGYVGVARGDDGQAPAALFHPAGDAVELAAQLRRVIGDPALRESLNEAGARRCREYSMDRLATAYEMIYEAIQPQPKQRWRGGLS